jgi:hypothetical protein
LYIDFLQDVKYSLSEKIAGLINQAFEVLDKKHEQSLPLELLTKSYNPLSHPHSLSRRKNPENIQAEFVNAITRKADQSGRVSQAAFVDYYSELNFCIPNERENVRIGLCSTSSNLSSVPGTSRSLKTMSVNND